MKRYSLFLMALLLCAGAMAQTPNLKQAKELKPAKLEAAGKIAPKDDLKKSTVKKGQIEKKVGAKEQPLKMETFYLSNGLKVIVAEDHSEPKIYGSVIVHAGAKNEDTAATGVAHYFEHIMFKGTDQIGTTDWKTESLYLDSISKAYDRLHEAKSDAERHDIQLEINRLNIAASKYAIANETDAILQQMGCTGLNAFTSYDVTCYHNTLPSNQLENWMEVYAERFRNPVYRLFQGELEAVYEERNMYANEMMYAFQQTLRQECFGEHPYSRDVIGYDRHLKCPQPSAMKKFYDKYYVASNMTLLLVGDLDIKAVHEMAERYFSIWPKGESVKEPTYKMPDYGSRVVKNVKQTPIKAGIILFPGVKQNDPDELLLDVMGSIISGGNGRLDELATEGKLMGAYLANGSMHDGGINAVIYIPKLVGQKHEAAEELVWQAIDSVKAGNFSDKLLESIKMNNLVSRKRLLESYRGIASLLQSLELSGSNYEQWLKDNERLQSITKQDIMDVAKRYYDRNHCTIIRSSMGFPDKESAIKPDWDHLDAQNQGMQSDFAKKIAERKVEEIKPQTIDFKKEVTIVPVTKNCMLYASPNPKNDLFSITIAYHYGSADNHNIESAVQYFSQLGADNMTLSEYNIEMDCLGGSFSISSGYDYSYINISGLERNMDKIIALAVKKLRNPRHDKQQIDNIVEGIEASKKSAKDDPDTWTSALYEYVLYGDKSSYIDHPTVKEIKKMKGEDLVALIGEMFGRDGYVTYVGNESPKHIVELIREHHLVEGKVTVMPLRIRVPQELTDSAVYYCTNKKFLQSNIDLLIPSNKFDYDEDRAACVLFNEYMGGGMNSVFFQEIREFRSLGYSTHGYFSYDRFNRKPAYYYAYLGTQCDKTQDGIAALRDLMVNFPERKEKFLLARDYLISVRNSNYITFRSIPSQVRYWMEVEKLDADPRAKVTEQIRHTDYADIMDFHKKYVYGRPVIIFISGNAKKFNPKGLSGYGKVQEVKYKNMIKF